mmetsp:Transcript_17985/g.36520  ORF Transcript_17985/g.36520 Transcript_17985/m.36520 type:complete len:106 (-) Transcript_17985:65-382(-)
MTESREERTVSNLRKGGRARCLGGQRRRQSGERRRDTIKRETLQARTQTSKHKQQSYEVHHGGLALATPIRPVPRGQLRRATDPCQRRHRIDPRELQRQARTRKE